MTAGLTAAGQAVLEAAQALAQHAAAPATLRAYKADWAHFAAWCVENNFLRVPAEPMTVGAYLAIMQLLVLRGHPIQRACLGSRRLFAAPLVKRVMPGKEMAGTRRLCADSHRRQRER